MLRAFVTAERARCANPALAPAAETTRWWAHAEYGFTGNLLGGWLGFWASPEVRRFGRAYGPKFQGYWRWPDQQHWHLALGLVQARSRDCVELST
mmetsp:Transcript_11791/g.34957  ORF Transcript_11791/g.34957 Transcript_11791/m.34957 type:complete len:95 (-) Transcript_11791:292-576(-)